jgi:hypothetical protein
MTEPLDLEAVRARWGTARMAGEAADDGEEGWDLPKIRALVASWQDVALLHAEVERLRARLDDRDGVARVIARCQYQRMTPRGMADAVVKHVRGEAAALRQAEAGLRAWDQVIASPPAPWVTYGSHVDDPHRPLVFWGTGPDGLPLWEREA